MLFIRNKLTSHRKNCDRSMRRELSIYILGLAVISTAVFTHSLISYFDRGLHDATRFAMLVQIRAYETEYLKDPATPLPNTYTNNFFFDDWNDASDAYKKMIPFGELRPHEFTKIKWIPDGKDDLTEAHFIVVYWHILPDGRNLYMTSDFPMHLFTYEETSLIDETYSRVIYLGGGYLLLMVLGVWLYNRRISRHSEQLAAWADSLSLDNVSQPRPDFRYLEQNRVADTLQRAFERISSLIRNEQQFLRHASHELRTPIAVIRSNMEFLDRVGVPPAIDRPICRIRRANHGMQQLTETLLWLSRDNETAPALHRLSPSRLVDEVCEDLSYLLQDKGVEVSRLYQENLPEQLLPETPLRIVVGNLVRNAFQYTYEGTVRIYVNHCRIVIENHDPGEVGQDSDKSFGLGLMLVTKVCKRLNWPLTIKPSGDGMLVELNLQK